MGAMRVGKIDVRDGVIVIAAGISIFMVHVRLRLI